jgi:hypothetical protein
VCGTEFTRRKNSRNAKIYCSLACANKETKKKHHIVLRDDDVVFDSAWEAFFYGACKIAKIPIERFDRDHGVAYDPEYLDRWYAPDFWLPDVQAWVGRTGVAIEIKGVEDDRDETRWTAFRSTGVDLVVMDRYRMENLSAHSLSDILRVATMRDNPALPCQAATRLA